MTSKNNISSNNLPQLQLHHMTTSSFSASITEAAKIEKIVDYSFERSEKSNVLAIHPTRPLIAYLINIQRTQKISKAWSGGYDNTQSPSSLSSPINGRQHQQFQQQPGLVARDKSGDKTVSIRIIDYVTRHRCLAKGIYHARPADCVFTINSIICSQDDIIKLAVVDRLANVYLYDVSKFIDDLTATRIAVIRGPGQEVSPYESISLVWCPFVPCEDFDDGDGGLRLALATNSRIEIFAVDRLQGKTGELQRSDLKGAYKCINDAHKTDIVTLSISPDCSTISAAALDNRVTFFSSDIDDSGKLCLHNWEASITDNSSISKLFFLDDYPKLLEDSTMKFWGAAFIGTKSGQMLLVDLRTWSVYQKTSINLADTTGTKNFNYQIDLTSRNIVAINGNQCYVVQIEHDCNRKSSSSTTSGSTTGNDVSLMDSSNVDLLNGVGNFSYLTKSASKEPRSAHKSSGSSSGSTKKQSNAKDPSTSSGLPKIVRTTRLGLHNSIYSFVIKHKSDDELELFTISAYSLERYIINLNAINREAVEDIPISASLADDNNSRTQPSASTPHELNNLARFIQQFNGSFRISSSGTVPNNTPNDSDTNPLNTSITASTPVKQEMNLSNLMNASMGFPSAGQVTTIPVSTASITANNTIVNNNALIPKNATINLEVGQMDRMVEALFTKLNTTFSQGLEEFLNDVKSEVNDLKLKLNGLCRDVRKLQQQLQETRQK